MPWPSGASAGFWSSSRSVFEISGVFWSGFGVSLPPEFRRQSAKATSPAMTRNTAT